MLKVWNNHEIRLEKEVNEDYFANPEFYDHVKPRFLDED